MLLSSILSSFIAHRPETALRLRRAGDMEEAIRMVAAGEAELGFGEMTGNLDDAALHFDAIWQAAVVIVSPVGTDLPAAVAWSTLAKSRLVLPPDGTGRRKLIDDAFTANGSQMPWPALATDERSAWVSSAQQGVGSFLCYESVALDLHDVERRPFDPPLRAPSASCVEPTRSRQKPMSSCSSRSSVPSPWDASPSKNSSKNFAVGWRGVALQQPSGRGRCRR
jgi:DNA-binding transcriptional LysR family regulator